MFLFKNRFLMMLAAVAALFSFSGCSDDETDPLIAHYQFEGNANDAAGTFHGAEVTLSYANGEGVSGHAASFNGVSNYFTVQSRFDLREKTISLWVNANVATEGLKAVYTLDNPSLSYGMTIISIEQSGEQLSLLYNCSREIFSTPVNANEWYHVALVTNGYNYAYYLNGVEMKTGTMIEYISSGNGTTDAVFGASRVIDRFFEGKMDEVKIYNKALTAVEIAALAAE